MKVFISWSGERSHNVADALAGWLKKVIQSIDPWVSSDMERGVKWLSELSKSLDEHTMGILCVTPGNVKAPWINFEAGALSRQIDDTVRVVPYLLDFRSASELSPPLGQFNASLADEDGTFKLVKTLNAHAESKLTDMDLDETFKLWWPGLSGKLQSIKASVKIKPQSRRTIDDKVDELLDLTRQLIRGSTTSPTPEVDSQLHLITSLLMRLQQNRTLTDDDIARIPKRAPEHSVARSGQNDDDTSEPATGGAV